MWEYEIIERPNEILLILYKKDENTRGYIRLTSTEELTEWKKVLESHCSMREL